MYISLMDVLKTLVKEQLKKNRYHLRKKKLYVLFFPFLKFKKKIPLNIRKQNPKKMDSQEYISDKIRLHSVHTLNSPTCN